MTFPEDKTMRQPEKSLDHTDDSPKFGRLLIVLVCAVLLIVAITFATEAYYS
jgi:hypothetical protein